MKVKFFRCLSKGIGVNIKDIITETSFTLKRDTIRKWYFLPSTPQHLIISKVENITST